MELESKWNGRGMELELEGGWNWNWKGNGTGTGRGNLVELVSQLTNFIPPLVAIESQEIELQWSNQAITGLVGTLWSAQPVVNLLRRCLKVWCHNHRAWWQLLTNMWAALRGGQGFRDCMYTQIRISVVFTGKTDLK